MLGSIQEPQRMSWKVCHVPMLMDWTSRTVMVQLPIPDSPLTLALGGKGSANA